MPRGDRQMNERMQTVATYTTSIEANLAKNCLEAAGIRTCLVDQESVGMVWSLANAYGGIKLQVSEEDAQEAVAILEEVRQEARLPPGQTAGGLPFPDDIEHRTDGPAEMPDEPEPVLTSREENADRAWRGSVLGVLLAPLQVYVSWLLLKVLFSKERLSADKRRRALRAAFINLPFIFGFCTFFISVWLSFGHRGSPDSDEDERDWSQRRNAIFQFRLGEFAFEKADYDRALDRYTSAIALDPEYAEAYLARGDTLAKRGKLDLAVADFTRAIAINPSLPDAHNSRGSAYRDKGQLAEALADHDEAISKFPKSFLGHLERAWDYEAIGDNERALADYDHAVRLEPSRLTYEARGLAHLNQGNGAQAVADATEALRIDPNHARAHTLRGMAYSAMGQYDEAISDFDRSLKLNPRDYHTHVVRGMAYRAKGESQKALVDFQSAIRLDPMQTKAFSERAQTYRELGDEESADRDDEKVRELLEE